MQAGRLRHRVTILNFTSFRDTTGQPVEEWLALKTISAEVKGRSGREMMASGAEHAEATIRVWVRFKSGSSIYATSRLKVLSGPYKGQTLNVVGPPIPDPKGTQLEILCKQGTEK